jgi:hypothetical protein
MRLYKENLAISSHRRRLSLYMQDHSSIQNTNPLFVNHFFVVRGGYPSGATETKFEIESYA